MTNSHSINLGKFSKAEIIYALSVACFILSSLVFVIAVATRGYFAFRYENETAVRINVATTTADVTVARQQLDFLVQQAVEKGWTAGYVSAYVKSEDENLSTWFSSLMSARDRIAAVEHSESKTEVSSVLLSVQSSFKAPRTYEGPNGISVFPKNRMFANILLISFIILCVLFIVMLRFDDNASDDRRRRRYEGIYGDERNHFN